MDLKNYLDSRNISNREFADMLDISENAVRNYREGLRQTPLHIALRIRKATKGKVSIHDLLLKRYWDPNDDKEDDF
jgi:DNA-binding transcriptional regulator YdaS (Cro superfamily)